MALRDATAQEVADWSATLAATPGGYSFFQDLPFGTIKAPAWQPRPMVHDLDGTSIPVLYLVRSVPFFGEFWYAPDGPRVTDAGQFRAICADLAREATKAVSIVLEAAIPADGPGATAELVASVPGLRPHGVVQAGQHTVVIDLSPSEDDIFASFRQRARRTVRKAEGAVVEHLETEDAFAPFWSLYTEMLERTGLVVHPQAYFHRFWRTYLDAGQGHFVLARPSADADYAAGAFCLLNQGVALYKDGGSTRAKDAGGLQYLVQWEAMKWAKAHGATRFDMWGAPASWNAEDPADPLHGMVQFKTAFGPIVDRVDAVELVRTPRMLAAWEKVGRRAWNLRARFTHQGWF